MSLKKILNIIFPIFDFLYIFQSMEYEIPTFFKWSLVHIFSRNLQKKHKLNLTFKAILILFTSILFIFIKSFLIVFILSTLLHLNNIILLILIFLTVIFFCFFFSFLFLTISQLFFLLIENYQKNKLITQAKDKTQNLPNLKIVAITGSFAKTSTKDILYTLLWKKHKVIKTFKSFNTPISIARTILEDLKQNTEIFLAEMDAYHPGEIDRLCQIAKPEFGIITAIAPQHLERFGSMDSLAKTQFEIIKNIKRDGIIFLNSSDDWSMKLLKQDATYQIKNNQCEIKIFGFEKDDDFYASDIMQKKDGLEFILHYNDDQIKIHLPLFGAHHVINFVGASAIAVKLGMTLEEIQKRAKLVAPTPHRLEIKKQGNTTIIDNSYNTNPTVAKASLELLNNYPGKQKILITPGLIELGTESFFENKKFGQNAANIADIVIIVGSHAKKAILEGLNEAKFDKEKIYFAESFNQGMEILKKMVKPETIVLIENDLPDQYS